MASTVALEITLVSDDVQGLVLGPDQFVTAQNVQDLMIDLQTGNEQGYLDVSNVSSGQEAATTAGLDASIITKNGDIATLGAGNFFITAGNDFSIDPDPTITAQNMVEAFEGLRNFELYFSLTIDGSIINATALQKTDLGNAIGFSVFSIGNYATGWISMAGVGPSSIITVGEIKGTAGIDFTVGPTDGDTAIACATYLNGLLSFSGYFTATANGNLVELSCNLPGTIANAIPIISSSSSTSATTFTGGTDSFFNLNSVLENGSNSGLILLKSYKYGVE